MLVQAAIWLVSRRKDRTGASQPPDDKLLCLVWSITFTLKESDRKQANLTTTHVLFGLVITFSANLTTTNCCV